MESISKSLLNHPNKWCQKPATKRSRPLLSRAELPMNNLYLIFFFWRITHFSRIPARWGKEANWAGGWWAFEEEDNGVWWLGRSSFLSSGSSVWVCGARRRQWEDWWGKDGNRPFMSGLSLFILNVNCQVEKRCLTPPPPQGTSLTPRLVLNWPLASRTCILHCSGPSISMTGQHSVYYILHRTISGWLSH